MTKMTRYSVMVAALFATALAHREAHAQETGMGMKVWAGGSMLFGQPAALSIHLSGDSRGAANAPQWRVSNRTLSFVKVTTDSVNFDFPSTTGALYSARGRRYGNRVKGVISRGADSAEFHLIEVARPRSDVMDSLVGFYDVVEKGKSETARHIITPGAYGNPRWRVSHGTKTVCCIPSMTRRLSSRPPLRPTRHSAGRGSLCGVTNRRRSSRSRLVAKTRPGSTRNNSYGLRTIAFQNGDTQLAGTLILPATDSPAPVVVFVPGSGDPASRDDIWYRQFDDFFLQKGIGVLVYDKRGTGKSSGDWKKSSFEDLALDVVAGVKKIAADKSVDATRIAVWGFSQGGWIAPLAATMSSDISLVMVASGGAVSPWESEIAEQVARMRRAKMTPQEIDSARAFMQLQINAVRGKADRARFEAAIPAAKDKPWYKHTWGNVPEAAWLWSWWISTSRYDPDYVLSQVRVPMLAIFSQDDELTITEDVPGFAGRMQKALARGGNRDFTGVLLSGVGHDCT